MVYRRPSGTEVDTVQTLRVPKISRAELVPKTRIVGF
jgi:hypothetical protein